jgi:hypothetical protein
MTGIHKTGRALSVAERFLAKPTALRQPLGPCWSRRADYSHVSQDRYDEDTSSPRDGAHAGSAIDFHLHDVPPSGSAPGAYRHRPTSRSRKYATALREAIAAISGSGLSGQVGASCVVVHAATVRSSRGPSRQAVETTIGGPKARSCCARSTQLRRRIERRFPRGLAAVDAPVVRSVADEDAS